MWWRTWSQWTSWLTLRTAPGTWAAWFGRARCMERRRPQCIVSRPNRRPPCNWWRRGKMSQWIRCTHNLHPSTLPISHNRRTICGTRRGGENNKMMVFERLANAKANRTNRLWDRYAFRHQPVTMKCIFFLSKFGFVVALSLTSVYLEVQTYVCV